MAGHTYTVVDTTSMDWRVVGILDPGDTHGFAYTDGLHRRGRAELLVRDIPAMHIPSGLVARVLNCVAACDADPVGGMMRLIEVEDRVFCAVVHDRAESKRLQEFHLCTCDEVRASSSSHRRCPLRPSPGLDQEEAWASAMVFFAAMEAC